MTQAASSSRRPLLRAAEVCEVLKVQPYVLRSWEKEFPNLGISKTADGQRLYRRSDVDEALRIKQLVFGDGLTIAGARRRLEEERASASGELPFEEEEAGETRAVPRQTRARIERIRRGLQSILTLIDGRPRAVASNGDGAGAVSAKPVTARKAAPRRTTPNGSRQKAKRRSSRG